MTLIGKLLYGLKNAVSPNLCPVCGKHLVEGEEALCIGCEAELPRILLNGASCPDIEDLFVGSKIVDKAVSMFAYSRTSVYSALLKDIKYHNRASLAQFLGQQFARELKALGYFEEMDVIVPVPLHYTKLDIRGYNQSRQIALGLSMESGLPVNDAVIALHPHATQTFRTIEERHKNVNGVFSAKEDIGNYNVVLVDDVITTGATLIACCDALQSVGVKKVNVLSLAFASSH